MSRKKQNCKDMAMTSPLDSFLASMPLLKKKLLALAKRSISPKTKWSKLMFITTIQLSNYPTIQLFTPPPFTAKKKNSTHPNHHPITSHAPEFLPQLSQASIVLLGSPSLGGGRSWQKSTQFMMEKIAENLLSNSKDMIWWYVLNCCAHFFPSFAPLTLAKRYFGERVQP